MRVVVFGVTDQGLGFDADATVVLLMAYYQKCPKLLADNRVKYYLSREINGGI